MQQHFTPIFTNGGRCIGKVEGNIFYKSIKQSHFLQRPPAIAFDVDSLQQAENAGAEVVQVKDRDSGTTYKTSIKNIREKGRQFNRGYGEQIFLVLDGWIKTGNPVQIPLFVGGTA